MPSIFSRLGKEVISIADVGVTAGTGGFEAQLADNTIIKHRII
jgi:hypothetical protein